MKAGFFIIFFLILKVGFSQLYTISGIITDEDTREVLIGSNIYAMHNSSGTSANNFGFYSLTLPSDTVEIRYSFVGYLPVTCRFILTKDTVINMHLKASAILEEIIITSDNGESNLEMSQMSSLKIPINQMKKLPTFLGEIDIMKSLQLLPGVQSGSEGSSGLYVRGGGPDQNLILLDGVPVYNASHLFGFFSVFNSEALNNVTLIKGGFPARYGGRLSSVIDVQAKEGNMREFHGEGSIGLISSRLTLEGPIQTDKTSFIISGRRTYADLFVSPIVKAASKGNETIGYFFYDLNAKINHKISIKDRIFLSAYMGRDKAYSSYKDEYDPQFDYDRVYQDKYGLKWGNITTAFRWNHILHQKLFSNTMLTYSKYKFDLYSEVLEKSYSPDEPIETDFYKERYFSQIQDFSTKIDFDYLPNPNHYLRFGINATHHEFQPGAASYVAKSHTSSIDSTFGATSITAWEYSTYLEDDFRMGERLKLNVGLHASAFQVRNELYYSLQPRISAGYKASKSLTLKTSYAEMTQYIHLLTNSGIGLPTDLWVPATNRIRPQNAKQVALGMVKSFNPSYELTIEGFYKTMDNLIEYREGASFLNITDTYEDKVESGKGTSYGMEVLLQKKMGSLTGWMGYTLSWNNRTFDNINDGNTFPYKYDRRHDFSLALVKTFNEKVSFSASWIYGTGNAVSLPIGSYGSFDLNNYSDSKIDIYSKRNEYRMRDYHRLDVSVSFRKKKKWGERTWTFGLYNAYSRRNPFYIDIKSEVPSGVGPYKFVQYSLFPILPSISYSLKF